VYHRSKEYFGEDADDFNPERWLKPSSNELEKYYIPVRCFFSTCVFG
jgi:cytochrome P450